MPYSLDSGHALMRLHLTFGAIEVHLLQSAFERTWAGGALLLMSEETLQVNYRVLVVRLR